MSEAYNQHSMTDPWYRAGQGVGNVCPQWTVQANSLTLAYNNQAHLWQMSSPDQNTTIQQGFDTFVDDTNLFSMAAHTQLPTGPIHTAQHNLNIWNDLLQASRGELITSKCIWFHFFWQTNNHSTVSIAVPLDDTPPITLSVHHEPPVPIKRLTPSEAHCYLGIQLTTNGNYMAEMELFCQQNECFVRLLHQCPFSYSDVTGIYKQCYLPTISYPLPATSIPAQKLRKLQSPATSIFLTKMGYPCTFLRAVAYAASDCGGIGFHHLGHEQGVQKCMQLIKHVRSKTSTGTVISVTLQHYQLMSGLSHSILQDTRPLPWSAMPWTDTLCSFLHTINDQIILEDPWSVQSRQYGDRFIMEDVLAYHLPKAQAIQIQSVRLYLRISLLSEIVDHRGTHVITAMLYLAPCAHHDQHYCQNASTLQWPQQNMPSPLAWKQWHNFISCQYLQPNSMQLQQPLGPWLPTHTTDFTWQ